MKNQQFLRPVVVELSGVLIFLTGVGYRSWFAIYHVLFFSWSRTLGSHSAFWITVLNMTLPFWVSLVLFFSGRPSYTSLISQPYSQQCILIFLDLHTIRARRLSWVGNWNYAKRCQKVHGKVG
jgi:hypothetical protein